MNILPRNVLTISILVLLSLATLGAALNQAAAAAPLPDRTATDLVGGSAWGNFFTGVTCGVGVGLLIAGYASTIAAPAAALLTVGTLRQCAAALGY